MAELARVELRHAAVGHNRAFVNNDDAFADSFDDVQNVRAVNDRLAFTGQRRNHSLQTQRRIGVQFRTQRKECRRRLTGADQLGPRLHRDRFRRRRVVVATWLLWELWLAAKPRAIADDFLKLLHDSFARDWRNPLTRPWARLAWAYGFTLLGASSVVAVGLVVWSLAFGSADAKPLRVEVHTSESFEVRQSP